MISDRNDISEQINKYPNIAIFYMKSKNIKHYLNITKSKSLSDFHFENSSSS